MRPSAANPTPITARPARPAAHTQPGTAGPAASWASVVAGSAAPEGAGSAPLCADLPRGEYDVAYRVVYSDGHSEERSLEFTVEDPQAPAPGTAPSGCGVAAVPI